MRIWPFRREARAQGLTDLTVQYALSLAAGGRSDAEASATSALEAAAGFVGRAFASADVQASGMVQGALTPECLALIGRQLIRSGEAVFLIATGGGRLQLIPCSSYSVTGGPDPESWVYELTAGGPSETRTVYGMPGDGVIHCRFATDPADPWRGVSPIRAAELAGRLSAETVAALADESSGPRGSFMAVPGGGESPETTALKRDIRDAGGDVLLGKSGTWDQAAEGGAGATYQQRRFGPSPGPALVDLADFASREVLNACGLPPVLFGERGDGAAQREGYRRALHATIAPLGRIVAGELTTKLEAAVAFDWAELRAADIASRARAFKGLVESGIEIDKALGLSGLMTGDAA